MLIEREMEKKKITGIFIHSCEISCSLHIYYQITNHMMPLENLRHCCFLDILFYTEFELIHSRKFQKNVGLSQLGCWACDLKSNICNKILIVDSHGPNESKFNSKTLKKNWWKCPEHQHQGRQRHFYMWHFAINCNKGVQSHYPFSTLCIWPLTVFTLLHFKFLVLKNLFSSESPRFRSPLCIVCLLLLFGTFLCLYWLIQAKLRKTFFLLHIILSTVSCCLNYFGYVLYPARW